MKPNLIVILIDDLRFDETGASGHPYMKTPHIDRLAHEGAMFANAFHTTPLCSPNRASILTGQYASRHGIIDNVGRDAMSHRLANYHLALQSARLRDRAHRQVAHGQRRRAAPGLRPLGELPRPGHASSIRCSAENGKRAAGPGLRHRPAERARRGVRRAGSARQPFALFLAHKAVHPDVQQNAGRHASTCRTMQGYVLPERHKDLYKGATYPDAPERAAARARC